MNCGNQRSSKEASRSGVTLGSPSVPEGKRAAVTMGWVWPPRVACVEERGNKGTAFEAVRYPTRLPGSEKLKFYPYVEAVRSSEAQAVKRAVDHVLHGNYALIIVYVEATVGTLPSLLAHTTPSSPHQTPSSSVLCSCHVADESLLMGAAAETNSDAEREQAENEISQLFLTLQGIMRSERGG
ncbi:hypothetical protein BHE74_00003562 [Ensete ventricosum]|nr:hypothetical protein BHE74_00003562 [Ensete ventricosum]